jgi:L,D-transpeptidase catalytic domain
VKIKPSLALVACLTVLGGAQLAPTQAGAAEGSGSRAGPAPTAPEGSQPPEASAPTPPATPVAPPSERTPPVNARLSNERMLTTWAHPARPAWIHSKPGASAPRITQLHMMTEEGLPEVYPLLASHATAQGRRWIELRIPGRPNGRVGWVRRGALRAFHVTRWAIRIDLREQLLRAYHDGHLRMVAPVGVGKPSTPTPTGHFWIRERFPIADRGNPYWPYALGTSDYSSLTEWPGGGVVGIHGDFGEPQQIPGDPSHGCVRMRDKDIAWLGPHVTLGTPVRIVR